MRSDEALYLDMLLACGKILRFTVGLSKADFEANELIQSAVLREIQVIGEAARMVSDESKKTHNNIEWRQISGMRNRVIHEYFAIRLDIVWLAVTDDIPTLIDKLRDLIPSESEIDDEE
ncbi:MAG: DUF86 domain-containing protein [Chloroflexota bacterium]